MDYSDSNITLSDSLSGYITANEDECDNTRYLSALSQDLTSQEMNVTLSNEQIEEHNGTMCTKDTNQPLIFTVDGTDEICGVQVAEDEDGNFRKYQIQYSENMNGELEPMLETIQLLPLDYEETVIPSEENCSSSEVSQSNDNFIITNEEFISDNSKNNFTLKNSMGIGGQENINGDAKELNIPITSVTSYQIPVKSEPEDLFDRSSRMGTADGNIIDTQNSIELAASIGPKEEEIPEVVLGLEDDGNNIMAVQHIEIQHCLEQEELYEETIEEKHFEQLFLEENHVIDTNQFIGTDTEEENDQQNDLYHILNSVAANSEDVYDQSLHTILQETVDHHPKTNILKKPVQKSLLKDFINSEQKIVYVQTLPEKENLTVMDIESFTKPNSRSLLKCNQPPQVLKKSDLLYKDGYPQGNLCIKAVSRTKELKPTQTYLRTKEAKQARQFMNFINSTTIPQVPERKGRLPRKQQIKPVKHPDEDIVVKEMIVSSNGFVEPISAEERKYLPVTEYVELLDSGDELCNNKKKKRKNNGKDELIEIEISDTDESDIGVVELETTPNGKLGNESKNGVKKKRGRPPKSKTSVHEKKDVYPNSPPKISRLDSDVESVTSTLQVIRMENDVNYEHVENALKSEGNTVKNFNINKEDEKSMGNESSKGTQYNSSKSSQSDSKNKVSSVPCEVTSRKIFEYKYECEKCKTKFINKFLQSRHNCVVKVGLTFSCDICQQKFQTTANLNVHKKTHLKGPSMVKPTLTKIPQVKEVSKKDTVPGISLVKSSVSSSRSSVVSKAPLKIPSRQSVLPSKELRPSSISLKSARVSVLPSKSKQLVVPVKAAIQVPKNCALPIKNNNSEDASEKSVKLGDGSIKKEDNTHKSPSIKGTPEGTPNTNIFKCEKQCNNCSMRFENHSAWFNHQVLKHGLKTPDKSIGEKKLKKIVKDKAVHNGIRTAPTVAKNFSMLKNMVQHI